MLSFSRSFSSAFLRSFLACFLACLLRFFAFLLTSFDTCLTASESHLTRVSFVPRVTIAGNSGEGNPEDETLSREAVTSIWYLPLYSYYASSSLFSRHPLRRVCVLSRAGFAKDRFPDQNLTTEPNGRVFRSFERAGRISSTSIRLLICTWSPSFNACIACRRRRLSSSRSTSTSIRCLSWRARRRRPI